MIRRLYTLHEATKAEGGGSEFADQIDVRGLGDLVLQPERPVSGVDEQAAEPRVLEILSGSHRGREDAGLFAARAGEGLGPGDGHHRVVLLTFQRRVGRLHPGQDLAHDEWLAALGQGQSNGVDIGRAPDIAGLDSLEDRVLLLSLGHQTQRALPTMVSVVVDPSLTQHATTESPLRLAMLPMVILVGRLLAEIECMGRGPQADHRAARLHIVDDVLHLIVRQIAEPGGDNHQVGCVESLESGDVVVLVGVDLTAGGVDREQDRTFETVAVGQNLAELGQALLGDTPRRR